MVMRTVSLLSFDRSTVGFAGLRDARIDEAELELGKRPVESAFPGG
jgi:hypothetical protein